MRRVVLLALTWALAACGGLLPSRDPDGSSTAVAPSPDALIAGVADAFVATVVEAPDGTTTNDLQIDLVSAGGVRRPVATLTELTAGLPEGSRLIPSEAILVSPGLLLTVGVDVAAAGVEGDVQRRLIFDLRNPDRQPIAAPGGAAAWGPNDRLAILGGLETTFVDPAHGQLVAASNPEGPTISTVWAADGSGLLGWRLDPSDHPIAGVLRSDGHFVDGIRRAYSTMGVGRPFGAGGTVIGEAVSDGADGSDNALTEQRPGGDRRLIWISVHAPGPDPFIFDHAWDAAGGGLWVLLGRDGQARLVHVSAPGKLVERAAFEMTGDPRIVGVDPNGQAVVVAMDATDTTRAALLRIDTSSGATVRIERPEGLSYFAGWAAVP